MKEIALFSQFSFIMITNNALLVLPNMSPRFWGLIIKCELVQLIILKNPVGSGVDLEGGGVLNPPPPPTPPSNLRSATLLTIFRFFTNLCCFFHNVMVPLFGPHLIRKAGSSPEVTRID